MYFAELREIVEANAEVENQAELLEFIDKQIETLEKRKAAAAERAEKKKSESDALTEAVFAQIGEDFITVDEIVEALGEEDITRNKVTARLGKLVKSGAVVKELVKTDNGKRMAYHLA
jgi:predicted Rossmann fold nucleotide-binding protein DprA/Smf involved in DNA uptake